MIRATGNEEFTMSRLGIRLPFRISTSDGKRTIDDLVFDQVVVNVPLGAADFAPSRR